MPMLLMLIATAPLLVRVAVFWPPACPTATFAQVIDVGDTVVCAVAAGPKSKGAAAAARMVPIRPSEDADNSARNEHFIQNPQGS